jgi:hypothetical protein
VAGVDFSFSCRFVPRCPVCRPVGREGRDQRRLPVVNAERRRATGRAMPSAWGGATTRHPASGAVERRAALLVNVLVRRELLACGCSAVTFVLGRALLVNLLIFLGGWPRFGGAPCLASAKRGALRRRFPGAIRGRNRSRRAASPFRNTRHSCSRANPTFDRTSVYVDPPVAPPNQSPLRYRVANVQESPPPIPPEISRQAAEVSHFLYGPCL